MKVVIDARCVFRGKGGIGRYTRGLIDALAWVDLPHDIVVILSGVAPRDDLAMPTQFETVTVPAGMIDEAWEQLHLPALLDRLGADLYFNPTFATPLVAGCLRVATIHDVVFERYPELVEPGLRTYLRRASRFTVGRADLILTVSEFSRSAKSSESRLTGCASSTMASTPASIPQRSSLSVPRSFATPWVCRQTHRSSCTWARSSPRRTSRTSFAPTPERATKSLTDWFSPAARAGCVGTRAVSSTSSIWSIP